MRPIIYYSCFMLMILWLIMPVHIEAANVFVIHGEVKGTDGRPIDGLIVTVMNQTKGLTFTGLTGESGTGAYSITFISFVGSIADVNDQIQVTVQQDGKVVATKTGTLSQEELSVATAVISFQLQPAPTLTSVSPNTGVLTGGSTVQLNGQNLQNGATITVGGQAATGVVFVSSTELTAQTPQGTAGSADVVVTNPDGQSAVLSGGFTYRQLAPIVVSITPDSDTARGGATVKLIGENFQSGTTVTFGGRDAVDVVVVSDTEITAKAPEGAVGVVEVKVTNPDSQFDVTSFRYFPPWDVNKDGVTNIFDLVLVGSNFGKPGPDGDVDGSGVVNIFDLVLVARHFGE